MAPRVDTAVWDGERVPDASTEVAEPSTWDADQAVTRLFAAHYRSLVRLATLLLREPGLAEDTVQDAYVALHAHWRRMRDADKGLAYLRQSVVNRSRSALRHRSVVDRYTRAIAAAPQALAPSAESGALGVLEHEAMITALRQLPGRQREALVLRYYGELSEAEIAEVMGVSRGAVKSHTARGMAAMRRVLEGS
jgi:RNA polymerase sigma-70 factor (sigma-E family)